MDTDIRKRLADAGIVGRNRKKFPVKFVRAKPFNLQSYKFYANNRYKSAASGEILAAAFAHSEKRRNFAPEICGEI